LVHLPTSAGVVIIPNIKARELIRRRIPIGDNAFAEMALWQLGGPVPPCDHHYKYRLALVFGGRCVVRYDNERGKGDHRHVGESEMPYEFRTVDDLVADFFHDARRWIDEYRDD
jgi:hypothetical protein